MAEILKVHDKKHLPSTKEYFLNSIPKENSILVYSILAFLILTFFIIFFCKIDDVVKAEGIIRVSGNVSSVENMISGKISSINYERGQKVEKGEVLYTLDSTMLDLQKENLDRQKNNILQKLIEAESLKKSFEANKNLCDKKNQKIWNKFESYLNEKRELEIRQELCQIAYDLEIKKPIAFTNQSLLEQKKLELTYAVSSLKAYKSKFSSLVNSDIYEYELALENIQTENEALGKQYEYLNVVSPISGYVQEFSALNTGDFLEKGTKVVNIVPDNSDSFRVEIAVSAKNIGKISKGLCVKYRLPAFPFFEYKGADGKITAVDPDIRRTDDGRFFYCVYADLDKTEFSNRKGKAYPVKAGLETDARIVLEKDTILKHILKKMDFLN